MREYSSGAIETIRKRQRDGFTFPCYGRQSLAEIVPTIYSIFDIKNYRPTLPKEFYMGESAGCDKVVLLFIDGLGYDQVLRYKTLPFFDTFFSSGKVNPITTVFPSTTAAAATTIHTGLTPQEHGLVEWNVYFEEFDRVIQTLPFKYLKGRRADELLKKGGKAEYLYSGRTAYENLRDNNVKSFVFVPNFISDSAYSSVAHRGAETVPYTRGSDFVVKLKKKIEDTEGPAYFHAYWTTVDSTQHEFGPHKEEHQIELSMLSHLITQGLLKRVDSKIAEKTLILFTADHGQIGVTLDEHLVYLENIVNLTRFFKRNRRGNLILPTGCARDLFLHIRGEDLTRAYNLLKQRLCEYAEILYSKDAFSRGLFGFGGVSEKFMARIGDIVILPRDHYLIWNRGFPKDPNKFVGIHGGLSEEEMIIPFGAARISDLISSC